MGGEHAHQLFPLGQETQQRPGPLQLVIGMLQEVELPVSSTSASADSCTNS